MGRCGRDCACHDVSRREFLQIGAGAVAAAGMAAKAGMAVAAPGDFPPSCQTPPPKEWFDALFERGEPPAYEGEALKNVAFPLGGIGTGTIWLHGTGRLTAWQIFNNINRSSQVDDSFFAIRVEEEGKPAVVRALQIPPVGPIRGVESLRFVGQYPFAHVDFDDPALGVKVRLEAFNPMIPLDDQNSGIPCAIFRLVAANPGGKPVRVSFLGSMQNAVGHQGQGASVGVEHATYGRNVNRILRGPRMLAVRMHAEPGTPAELDRALTVYLDRDLFGTSDAWPVRGLTLRSVGPKAGDDMRAVYWLNGGDLGRIGGGALTAIATAVRAGATLIVSGADNPLLDKVMANTTEEGQRDEDTFAEFESGTYGSWKAQGTGFGDGPARGTTPGQQAVSGYIGGGLVNTFNPDDNAQGSLVSPPFTIRRRYITFLIGGGNKPGKCCLNLRVDRRVVRTVTGKDRETLERQQWDVQDLLGREATLEIVDADTGGWGHVLVDDIRFSNLPTEAVTKDEAEVWNKLLPIFLGPPDPKAGKQERVVEIDRSEPALAAVTAERIRLAVSPGRKFTAVPDQAAVALRFDDGTPAIVTADRDKGQVFLIPADIVAPEGDAVHGRDSCLSLIAGLAGVGFTPAAGRPESAPSFGTMCFATPDTDAAFLVGWREREKLLRAFSESGTLSGSPDQDGPTGPGRTVNAALATERTLAPGGSAAVEFVLTWHFPNHYYPQNAWHAGKHGGTAVGNMYANWFHDAVSAATYVTTDLAGLRERSERFRRCLYDSSLPNYLVDCLGANASIIRSPTCFRIKDGTFYGFEGCSANSGCCPMNCNHVWNYEHALAKLWPALERNMRGTELVYHQQPDGGIHHRVEVPRTNPNKRSFPVADGQCGAVLKAYREHLQSDDRGFLNEHWERIRKAMDFAIANWDSNADGVMDKPQFNTYDDVIHGLNTFVSSLYLAALRGAEEMARLMKDEASAKRYRGLYESGRKFCAEKLYDGEYYIQIAENLHHGYGKGCFSDQVVGQWWARVLNLGDILPPEQVRSALQAIYKHSWLTSQKGFQGTQRYLQFADGNDKGLLICSWPKGGRPPGEEPILYRDEVWTGVEYQVAAHKIYEGQLREGLAIVKGARERYAGTKRNPWNEIECGDYYARAMSSWTLLLALQGHVYDGPAKRLGFNPRLHPDDHRSFFSGAQGWGRFTQKRSGKKQTNGISIAWGRCDIGRLELGLPAQAKSAWVKVGVGEKELSPKVTTQDGTAVLQFDVPVTIQADEALHVIIEWA